MNERTIAVRGDKGQAAELLGSKKNVSGVKRPGVGQKKPISAFFKQWKSLGLCFEAKGWDGKLGNIIIAEP